MSLIQEEIDKISKNLSKIGKNNNDTKSMNNILKYMKLLNNVNTDNVEPTISVIQSKSRLREDIEYKSNSNKELLGCSKQKIISGNIAISNIMK